MVQNSDVPSRWYTRWRRSGWPVSRSKLASSGDEFDKEGLGQGEDAILTPVRDVGDQIDVREIIGLPPRQGPLQPQGVHGRVAL